MKIIFALVMSVFMVGSIICAAAPSSPVFIFGRAVAGIGAGGVFSGALTIIARMVPLHKRALYNGGLIALLGVHANRNV